VKKKPSSCLKEVEKIKQKREERRAAQQALREQQDLEYDTTAPNWEFGAMIRFVSYLVGQYASVIFDSVGVSVYFCICCLDNNNNTTIYKAP